MKNAIRFTFVSLFILIFNFPALSQIDNPEKNSVKLSMISIISNVKISYERVIGKQSSIGLIGSYYYTMTKGYKFEPYYRYSFSGTGKTGWYMEGRIAFGEFETLEYFNEYKYVYNNDILINSSENTTEDFVKFNPIGLSYGTGYKRFFLKNEKAFFDFSFGLQYFHFYRSPESETSIIYNEDGTRLETTLNYGYTGDGFPVESAFWGIFGAGSILYGQVSVGVVF